MTYILGVDPGVVSGWCLFGDGKPLLWGQTGKPGRHTTGEDVWDVFAQIETLDDGCHQAGITLAIEGQYLPDAAGKGQKHRMQAVSTLTLCQMAGIWMGISQVHGAEMLSGGPIAPVTWRSAVWGGRWTTEQAKRHAVEMAAATWGIRILKSHHHEAEAMWIASYAWDLHNRAH
jgi:hypothetical protein